MFDINKLSPADAAHLLQTMHWLQEHSSELRAKAQEPGKMVSMSEVVGTFHQMYTDLKCTRLVPLTLSVFTDQDGLAYGECREPNVLINSASNPGAEYGALDIVYVHDASLSLEFATIGGLFNVNPEERIWRVEVDETCKLKS